MNRLALAVLVAAAGCFAAFHGLPAFAENAGWQLWVEVSDAILDAETFRDPSSLAGLATFLTLSLLLAASPLLGSGCSAAHASPGGWR